MTSHEKLEGIATTHHWVREGIGVLDRLLLNVLAAENNLDSALSAHDGNLGRRPSVVVVSLQMLGAHDVVGTTVRLSGNHSDLIVHKHT